MNFSVKKLLLFDRIRRFEGKKSLMEEFVDEFAPNVTTYKKEPDYNANEILATWEKSLFNR